MHACAVYALVDQSLWTMEHEEKASDDEYTPDMLAILPRPITDCTPVCLSLSHSRLINYRLLLPPSNNIHRCFVAKN